MSEDESQKQQANSLIAEIQNLLTQAQQISSDLGARHQSVSSQITELENQRSALQQVFASIEAIKSEAEGKKNSVDTDVQTITRKIEEFNALKDRLDGISNELQSKQPAIDNKFSEIEAAISQLKTEMGVLKQTIDAELEMTSALPHAHIHAVFDGFKKKLVKYTKRSGQPVDDVSVPEIIALFMDHVNKMGSQFGNCRYMSVMYGGKSDDD